MNGKHTFKAGVGATGGVRIAAEEGNLMYRLHEQELLPRSPSMHDFFEDIQNGVVTCDRIYTSSIAFTMDSLLTTPKNSIVPPDPKVAIKGC